jgi:hypothetical protein
MAEEAGNRKVGHSSSKKLVDLYQRLIADSIHRGISFFGDFRQAPALTCARQAASLIDVTLPCRGCRRASSPEPAIG